MAKKRPYLPIDYLAARAMNALLISGAVTTPGDVAQLAYDYAEAMLKERAQRMPHPPEPANAD